MKIIIILIFSLLEIPFIMLTWMDYYWNLLCKSLTNISFIFAIPTMLTIPITFMNGFVLASLIYLKNNLAGNEISFSKAIDINISRFPVL